MKKVTVFRGFNKVVDHLTLEEIVQLIKSDRYKIQIQKIRAAIAVDKKEWGSKLKKGLPAFTPSGLFSGGRKSGFLESYSSFIVLDVDKVRDDLVDCVKRAKAESFTKLCFISPSGEGLKIIVETDARQEDHIYTFNALAQYYEQILGVSIDRSGKDITRLCFFSWDPNIYYNAKSKVFSANEGSNIVESLSPVFEECVAFTQKKSTYVNGNRNNFLYLLASNCNRAGIAQSEALSQMISQYDLSPKEIQQSVASAYKNHPESFKKVALLELEQFVPKEEEISTPFMPTKIFQKLPLLIREGCASFKDQRERDVFLTGALTVLSGCLPNVSGAYDRHINFPNLFSFVIAPAASGKGALTFAKEIGMAYHERCFSESAQKKKAFRKEWQRYEMSQLQFKKGKIPDPPDEPDPVNLQLLFIPANSSSSMIVRHLHANKGGGILFETEADTLGNVLKQDWGGYSDILRRAFHHEPVTYSRKSDEDFFEIKQPRLSVALSGTPNQVLKLIPSAEDGLFSRFLFYVFESKQEWRDVTPKSKSSNLSAFYQTLGKEVLQMVDFLEKHPTHFSLAQDQWKIMNQQFLALLERTKNLVNAEALSIVKRLGVIFYRIAMILSACKKFEQQNTTTEITCEENEFLLALWMTEVYLEHSLFLYDRLPKISNSLFREMPNNKRTFFKALPKQFQRKEAVELGEELGLSAATVGRILKQLNGVLLEQPEYGIYQKK